jgi:glycerol kinase
LPLLAVMGDSHAALYGQNLSPGAAKVTYGTGSSVMTPVAAPGEPSDALSTTLAWLTHGPQYAREGNIIATGAALDALAQMLRLGGTGELINLATRQDTGSDVSFVPAFAGLGAPHWRRDATAVMVNLARGTGPGAIAWAGLDAVAQQVCDVIEAGGPVTAIYADGGASASGKLMQLQADLAGLPVLVSGTAELSAMGVARLAWRRLGEERWAEEPARLFQPGQDDAWRLAQRARWRDAVERSVMDSAGKAG